MENDMDRWLKEREKLSHRLEKLSQKKRRLLIEKGDSSLVEDMDDQIENLRANINYLHDNIVECQQNIVQMEQANENEEDERDEIAKIVDIAELGGEESKYLLEKLLCMTVNQTCLATQKEGKIKVGVYGLLDQAIFLVKLALCHFLCTFSFFYAADWNKMTKTLVH